LKNYYDVLKVSPNASQKEINDTHRSLVKQYHPDVNKSDDAHEKMTKLNEAYEVLSNKDKREKYDDKLRVDREKKLGLTPDSPIVKKVNMQQVPVNPASRADRAEQLRIKAEARLKNEEKKRQMMMEQAKKRAEKKAEEATRNQKKAEDPEKQKVIDLLAMLHRKSDARIRRNLETDEERHYAIKVLLSLIRDDNSSNRRIVEEAERKQRIEEILALVQEEKEGRAKLK